ncbi:protein-disulfide reductase DsbD family protein [Sphingomonas sp. NY01]|uniref:protein-disulfide reductase DsbD family protein n=1 Tax=Sphingomonas sp. NY01 TaxID=2968057 RepID=UPI00315C9149
MRHWLYMMMTLVLLFVAKGAGAQGNADPASLPAPHVRMTLIPETAAPAPGGRVTLAFSAVPQPGWHAYWSHGGDAGLGTSLNWTLPPGVTAGPLRYPVPGRLLISGLMNYVYEAPFALLADVSIPRDAVPGTRLPVKVKADYLVCTDRICVPESQMLSTALIVGDGAVEAGSLARFDAWRAALPRPLGSQATYQVADGRFRLAVPLPAAAEIGDVYFYPAAPGVLAHAAPQTVRRDGDVLIVETGAAAVPVRGAIAGVLATDKGRGLALTAIPGAVAGVTGDGAWRTALLALLGAVLGGVILNVMPCVFPILSLKALSLARGGATPAAARSEALAYSAGVVLVCVGLGAALLALRAGGATMGWAFQLQDPRVIGVLLLLVAGIAFNLAGLFELPTPAFAGRSGHAGAFATGALAAFVATPCTGPFMGAALGAALVLPTGAALLVFAGLGLGIALPFLLIGFVPPLRARLPRPGPWMATMRRVLSVPMFVTALALAWVLGRQAGVSGMTLGLASVLVASFGLWWTGRRQAGGAERAWLPALPALVAAVALVAVVQPAAAGGQADRGDAFSEAKLAGLRAQGRPVFAYFTADWCVTCKVNEAAAIERQSVRDAFRRNKVAVLVGDWTDGDPVLGRFIERHNRAGVPLYLYYAPGAAGPRVLPQVLTPAMLEALNR